MGNLFSNTITSSNYGLVIASTKNQLTFTKIGLAVKQEIIFYNTNDNREQQHVLTSDAPSVIISGLSPETEYSYSFRTLESSDYYWSPYSTSVTSTKRLTTSRNVELERACGSDQV